MKIDTENKEQMEQFFEFSRAAKKSVEGMLQRGLAKNNYRKTIKTIIKSFQKYINSGEYNFTNLKEEIYEYTWIDLLNVFRYRNLELENYPKLEDYVSEAKNG